MALEEAWDLDRCRLYFCLWHHGAGGWEATLQAGTRRAGAEEREARNIFSLEIFRKGIDFEE